MQLFLTAETQRAQSFFIYSLRGPLLRGLSTHAKQKEISANSASLR